MVDLVSLAIGILCVVLALGWATVVTAMVTTLWGDRRRRQQEPR